MTAPLSVIIPTMDVADRLGPCLGALGEAVMESLIREVILADGGSTDRTAEIADMAGARVVSAVPGRGSQLAAGAAAAQGDWLLFLHADTVLPEGWATMVIDHIQTKSDKAGYFRLSFASSHPMAGIVARWANLRSRLLRLPYGDQGLLISRRLYDKAGGHPAIPLMEDVALARRLRGRLVALPGTVRTSAERYERDGWFRRGARNLGTLLRYFLGVPPERLARRYERQ